MSMTAENVDVAEAQRIVSAAVVPLAAVRLPLSDALGLTLGEPVCTDLDDPPFDRALMDGYAVRSADLAAGSATLRVVGSLGAGAVADRTLQAGEALRINTGAPVPAGADAVVMVERSTLSDDGATVRLTDTPSPGQSITPRATHMSAGDEVLSAGTMLGPAQVAAAATAGAAQVVVYRRPRVAVLVTGNELVAIDTRPGPGQIRNSNGYAMAGLVREAGCELVELGIAGDNPDLLTRKIDEGLRADVLCITGGISMGQYDLVPDVLRACGVTFALRKIAVRPGKPTIFGRSAAGNYVFALPGNPVSCLVGFRLFVAPLLRGIQGGSTAPPAVVSARLTEPMRNNGGRQAYIPAWVEVSGDGTLEARPVAWHGSGDPFGMATANGLLVRDAGAEPAEPGAMVDVIPLTLLR
jgi:molybdopterin molybdotransferase